MKKVYHFLLAITCLFLTACEGRIETFGFENLKEESAHLVVKEDNKQSVLQKFNAPNAMSVDQKSWYYVYLEKEYVAFFQGKIINDILLKLTFDKEGNLVKKELIDHFLKKQVMLEYTTPIERSKKSDNYIAEIFGNIAHTASEEGRAG
ncbi:MAG: hypothetical protein H6850_02575 [Alphaproteobacteria bacterium]|nr:MAG: hypothetical protein H6850_02575 [Alphaproteobacteria bacterium]